MAHKSAHDPVIVGTFDLERLRVAPIHSLTLRRK